MMKQNCFCAVVWLITLFINGLYAQSPCPGVFDYYRDGSNAYGVIRLKSTGPVTSIHVRTNFTIPAKLHSNYVGNIEPYDTETGLINYNKGKDLYFKVNFPIVSPLPRLTALIVDGNTICSGTGDALGGINRYLTTTSLESLLYIETVNNLESTPTHKPNIVIDLNRENINKLPVFEGNFIDSRGSEIEPYEVQNYTLPTYVKPSLVVPSTINRPLRPYYFNGQTMQWPWTQRPQQPYTPPTQPLTPPPQPPTQPPTQSPTQSPTQPPTQLPTQSQTQSPTQPPTQPPQPPTQPQTQPPSQPTQPPQTTQSESPPQNTQRPQTPETLSHLPASEALSSQVECGIIAGSNEGIALIVKGDSYPRGNWPWLVAIYRRRSGGLTFICAGTLVSERHVITAGHCMHQKTKKSTTKDIVIKVGAYDLEDWGDEITQTRTLSSSYIHKSFNASTLQNDVLVVTLERKVKFNTYIRPACLWTGNPDQTRVVGGFGVVAGWGNSEFGPGGRGEPRMISLPIVNTDTCRGTNPDFHSLTSGNTLCAGDRKGSGPCLGDSGGGLYILDNGRWRLRGVVSISLRPRIEDESCNLNEYVVFTDTAQYMSWIIDIMSQRVFD